MKLFQAVLFSLCILPIGLWANPNSKELKASLNEDGSSFFKATFLNQAWLRMADVNPGSTLDGYPLDQSWDIGLRRTRIQLMGQVSEKVFVYTQIGQNNLSHNSSRKQGIFIHDAVGELSVYPKKVALGMGLTGWGGVSRYAAPAAGAILALDAPLYQQATVDVNDQFVRKYSLYAKGKLARIDYRVAISKPMTMLNVTSVKPPVDDMSSFSYKPPKPQLHGYIMCQLKDEESNMLPYLPGSYLGAKHILNIGVGGLFQKDAMWHTQHKGVDTVMQNLNLWSVDLFYEKPMRSSQGQAITLYGAFSYQNFGKDYVRNVGPMSPTNGTSHNNVLNGTGTAAPIIGTGTTAYAQAGYLFRKDMLKQFGTLQPYVAAQLSNYDALDDVMQLYNFGMNWLIDGHRSKISLDYQNRPIYTKDGLSKWHSSSRKGMLVLQYQVQL